MKKSVSILLALSLLFLCVPSFAAGAEITSVTLTTLSGGKIDVRVTAKNAFGAYFLAAAYSEDGSFLSSAELSDGNAVLDEDGVKSVKVFCWESSESMIPLCSAYEARYIPGGTAVEGVILSYYGSDPYRTVGDNSVAMAITKSSDTSLYAVGEIYSFSSEDAYISPLLGRSVSATVLGDEILSVSEIAELNSVLTVNTSDIYSIEADSVSYYPSSSAKRPTEVSIENTVFGTGYDNVIINGFESELYPIFDIFDEYWDLDEITFLDNDSDGSFEFVFADYFTDSGVEFPVKSVDLENCYIEGFGGTGDLFIESDYYIYTVIKDGCPASFEDIAAGDVITVLDNSVDSITIYVSSAVVEGTIDEVDSENGEFIISGSAYKVSPYSIVSEDDLSAGDEGVYYINYLGKIAYVDTINSVSGADYVYVIDAAASMDDFGDTSYIVKVVTADSAVKVLTIKSNKVGVYGNGFEAEYAEDDEANGFVKDYLTENDKGGIIKINTNAAGEITDFYFPGADGFEYTDKYANDAENKTRAYSEAKSAYGTISLTSGTIVFNIDTSEEDLEDAVTASTVGAVFADGSSYSFIAYGNDISDTAEVLVTVNADMSSLGLDPEAPVMVVTRKTSIVVNDSVTYRLTGIMDGSSVSVPVDPSEVSSASDIVNGNIIIFSENSSGLAQNIHVLFDSTKTALGELSGVENLISANTTEMDIVNITFGRISEKTLSYFQLEGVTDEYGNDVCYTQAAEGCRYILVEKTGSDITVKASTYSAVRKSTDAADYYAFVKTTKQYPDEATDVVVFKGFD